MTKPTLSKRLFAFLLLPLLTFVAASLKVHDASSLSMPNGWVSSTNISTPYFRYLMSNGNFTAWSTQVMYEFNNSSVLTISGVELKNTNQTQFLLPANSIYAITMQSEKCVFRGYRPGTDYNWANFIGFETGSGNGRDNWTFYFFNGNGGQAVSPNPMNLGLSFNCQTGAQLQVSSFVAFSPASGGGGSSIDYSSALHDILDAVEDLNTTYSSLETQIVALNTKIQQQTAQQQQQYEQPRTEATNAQTGAGTSGSASASDAATQGGTLLQGVTALVSALNVSPKSTCVIRLDLGNADFGDADLCSLQPPPGFQVISSLVVIGFAVPLSLAAAHKMVELFEGFA